MEALVLVEAVVGPAETVPQVPVATDLPVAADQADLLKVLLARQILHLLQQSLLRRLSPTFFRRQPLVPRRPAPLF